METHQLHAFLPLVTQRQGRVRNGRRKNAHFIPPLESHSKTSDRGVYSVFFLQRTPMTLKVTIRSVNKRSISFVEKSCLNMCSLHLRRRKKKKNSQQSVFTKLNGSASGINSESRLGVTARHRGTLPPGARSSDPFNELAPSKRCIIGSALHADSSLQLASTNQQIPSSFQDDFF